MAKLMRPWEVVDSLRSGSELPDLPESHPFWIGARYALDPHLGALLKLKLNDPPSYGAGLPATTFDKLALALIQKKLSGDALIIAIERVSAACTKEEWLRWYKPILLGTMRVPIAIDTFNKFAPPEYVVEKLKVPGFTALRNPHLPPIVRVEPFYDRPRSFWLVTTRDGQPLVRGYDDAGSYLSCPGIEESLVKLIESPEFQGGLVLEGYLNGNDTLHLRDVVTEEQFQSGGVTASLNRRYEVLENLFKTCLHDVPNIDFSWSVQCTQDDLIQELDMVEQQGFSAAIIRPGQLAFFSPGSNLVVRYDRKSILTVTSIEKNRIVGEGRISGKDVRGVVEIGLTTAKNQLPSDSGENRVGQKIEVAHCGSSGDQLILPKLIQWKGSNG